MFGLGMGEVLIILVLALILLGPQKLPDAAKQIGKGLREFRKATEDLKQQFETELYQSDSKPTKPTLVEPPKAPGEGDVAPALPPGGVPASAAVDAPPARADNVPGLEAALVDAAQPVTALPAPARPEAPAPESKAS